MSEQVEFHLSPALSVTGVIDYSTTEGRKYYEKSVEKLNIEPFDCETDDLHLFVDALTERAREMGWDIPGVGITDIFHDPSDPGSEYTNILSSHGTLTIQQIRAFEEMYIHTDQRAAQDTYAMYRCIMNSISKSAIKRLNMWKEEYTIGEFVSGNCLFKILVRESGLDTKTTATYIRTSLNNLPTYMNSVGDDILKFNFYVKGLVRSLQERGERSTDLLINVTQGYMTCKDKNFKRYISWVVERDEDDPLSRLTVNQLMVKAANKYKALVQNGSWKTPDDVDRELMALRAEVNRSNRSNRQSKEQGRHVNKKWKNTKTSEGKGSYFMSDEKWSKRPKWLRDHTRLKGDRPQVYEGVTFYYCCEDTKGKCDGRWVRHKPAECNNRGKRKPHHQKQTDQHTKKPDKKHNQKKVAFKKSKSDQEAAALVIESPDDSDSD